MLDIIVQFFEKNEKKKLHVKKIKKTLEETFHLSLHACRPSSILVLKRL